MKNFIRLFLVVLFWGGLVFGQASHYGNVALTTRYINGTPAAAPLPGSSVIICTYPGMCNSATKATLYTDNTASTQAANPVIADADGNFGFWAAAGNYQYVFTYNGVVHGPFPVSVGGSGGGTNGQNGQDGAPGAPGYSPNQITSGCGVAYVSGLTFNIGNCNYIIGNHPYSAAAAQVTGPASNPSLDRIDVIAVDKLGVFSVVPGTPAANPSKPILDPALQLEVTFYTVAAGAAVPSNITLLDIYHENTEWTCSASATFNCASTTNPHTGTKDIQATLAPTDAFVRLTIPAGTLDISTYNDLIFQIAPLGAWGTRSLTIQWYNGTTAKCTPVTLFDGQFGFNSSSTAYQQITVPLSLFNCAGIPVTRLQYTVAGTGNNLSFYLDDIVLQGGITNSVGSQFMRWLRAWQPSTLYKINDTVTYNGTAYTAIVSNSGLAPSANPLAWDSHDTHQPAGVDGNLQIKAGNAFGAINSTWDPVTSTIGFPGPVVATEFRSTAVTGQGVFIDAVTSPTLSSAGGISFISNAGSCQISQNGGAYTACSSAFGSGQHRTCPIILGDESGSALTTGQIQPQSSQCYADVAMTVYQIIVSVDSGASTVQLAYRHSSGGAPSNTNYTAAVLTPATVSNITDKVACANTGGTAITIDGVSVTCSALATGTWNPGDMIGTVAGTADGTTKRMSIFVSATVN